jgi:hypothetical protein
VGRHRALTTPGRILPVDPVDPDVFAGRDPAWREAWEELLDPESRKRVEDAIKGGDRLDDPALEPFVYGLIAWRRKRLRWRIVQAVILFVIAGVWVIETTVIRPSPLSWFWIAVLVIIVTVIPFKLRLEKRALDRAEEAQTSASR